ncbi:MAG: 3-deoxy-D-manno-octulosonic acid transferase [Candidatus Omnitrophica bacterium]|nr:3-deoxy-D-manno-octulosonic acid transferase [Candidatus Omnitrophota bacterium]
MLIIYDILLLIFALFYLPYAVFTGKFRRDFILRLGFLPKNIKFKSPIWLHAVSVGEILSARPLLERMRAVYPDKQIIISTITSTGNKIARGLAKDRDFVFYLPLDLSFLMRKIIKRINPCLCIIMETEIWPNLICGLNRQGVPILVVNARISQRSYAKYRATRFLFKPILDKINTFCTQSPEDAQRLISLGAEKDKVRITGNMKFDIQVQNAEERIQKTDLGLLATDNLLVAGSTHPGEEDIILGVYAKITKDFSGLKLLLAPRHPERAGQVAQLVRKNNFTPVFLSNPQPPNPNPQSIFILDTIGRLTLLYALADIVFVGGSLVKTGGHNVIEPAYFKKPIISGPYTHNFRDIIECFLKENALVIVKNKQELEDNLRTLLKDKTRRLSLGEAAFKLIQVQKGAVDKNLAHIQSLLGQ